MPIRPLAFVSALAGADYLLWNHSVEGNHDVLALISGFALVLLLIAFVWLILVCAARLVLDRPQRRAEARARLARSGSGSGNMAGRWNDEQEPAAGDPATSRPSGKLAA